MKYILGLIGDQFCDMVQQELQTTLLMSSDQKSGAVWKRPVRGVREMCDACKTTLFNNHWTCGRCGIVVCLDCFGFRKNGLVREGRRSADYGMENDEYDWPLCNNGEPHEPDRMLLAQIVPGTALVDLAKQLHEARNKWGIPQFCHRREELPTLFTDDVSS